MKIASGLEIYKPSESLETFIAHEYEVYDGVRVAQDDFIRPEEIALSMMVNSRITASTASEIWRKRKPIEEALSGIVPRCSICDDDAAIPWDSLEKAISGICRVPGAKVAVATKVLHKKRPSLIPILDSVIVSHFHIPSVRDRSWGGYAVALSKLFREDLLSVRPEIERMSCSLAARGKPITPCRIFEILMWVTLEPRGYYRREGRHT
jgi:hypothetical protein